MDVTSLLVLAHQTLSSVKEALLDLDQRQVLLFSLIKLIYQFVHHRFIR